MQEAVTFGEIGHEYFLIIKGVASILVPNPVISNWKMQQTEFDELLKWEREDFKPRMEIARQHHWDNYYDTIKDKNKHMDQKKIKRNSKKSFSIER